MPLPRIRQALPRHDDPTAELEAHYRYAWDVRRYDQTVANEAIGVAAVDFRQVGGDWVGVMVTPWFVNLFLVSGGGTLWGDIPAGERRYVELPCGTLHFIAADDPDIGPYQYCPLVDPVTSLATMAAAMIVARDAMTALLAPPPAAGKAADRAGSELATRNGPGVGTPGEIPSRRAFFRRLTGRR